MKKIGILTLILISSTTMMQAQDRYTTMSNLWDTKRNNPEFYIRTAFLGTFGFGCKTMFSGSLFKKMINIPAGCALIAFGAAGTLFTQEIIVEGMEKYHQIFKKQS